MRKRNSGPKPRSAWRVPVELLTFALYFLCGVLLILSRIGHGAIAEARAELGDLSSPLLELAAKPAVEVRGVVKRVQTYATMFSEIDRLSTENARLREWEWRARLLESKVEHLRKLLAAVDEPALRFATGNVIADARGPFVRSALINLGRADGVRAGYAVINGDGVVGRIVDTNESVTRVLLLNDLNSRIPVLVGPAAVRAIVSGDNSGDLTLDFIPDGASLYPGDEVYTSGSDGIIPRGLRVGSLVGKGGNIRVRPHADLSTLDVVSVIFFNTPALLSSANPDKETCEISTAEASAPPVEKSPIQGRKVDGVVVVPNTAAPIQQ